MLFWLCYNILTMKNKTLFTLVVFLLIGCLTILLLKLFWHFSDTKSTQFYKQGLEFYQRKDYQNAYYNFKKISFLSAYSVPALYRQATCAWELNDIKTAAKKYSKFANMHKNSALAPEAIWKLALLEEEKGNKKRSKAYLAKLVAKYPKSDFAKAAAYKLGLFYRDNGDYNKAKDYFVEYIEYAPLGRYSADVLNFLFEDYNIGNLIDSDKLHIAEALFINERYSKSISVLKEIPFDMSWFLLAKNYEKLSNFAYFEETLLKGVSLKQNKNTLKEKDLLDIMNLYIKKSAYSKEAGYNLILNTKENNLYPLSLFLYSKYVDKESAIKNYEKIYTDYPGSIVAPDALWFVFWHYYKKGDTDKALKLSKLYTNVYLDYNIQPKIMYWSAKIHLKAGRKKLAKSLLQNIVYNFPNSYYAFRADKILKRSKAPWVTNRTVKIKNKFLLKKMSPDLDTKENRLLYRFVELEDYSVIGNFKLDNPFLNSWLAALDDRKSYSVLLARDAIIAKPKTMFSEPVYKLAYPLYYKDALNKYAIKYEVSPYLMLSLTREESFFNNQAVSSTGALGLMQLMPATARLMDVTLYDNSKLFNPEYNISLGIKYFAHLMEIFNGNEPLCVLAYNSGPGSVKKWLNNFGGGDFDEFIENIPYPETANYIKKVYASYWVYMNIYEKI